MNLPALAIRYRAVVLTLVTLLMAWGATSYFTMPRREDPEYTVRSCAVTTSWPGAPTEKVEELITDKLEKAISTIDEVDHVRSKTMVGLSTIYVDAEETVSPEAIDNVWDKVRARVGAEEMPEPGIVPYVNDSFGDANIMLLAVYQTPLPGQKAILEKNRYSLRQLDIFSERIKDAIKLLPGVARCDQFGVREEAIYIETEMGNRPLQESQLRGVELGQLPNPAPADFRTGTAGGVRRHYCPEMKRNVFSSFLRQRRFDLTVLLSLPCRLRNSMS